MLRLIGDIHGHMDKYKQLMKDAESSLCLGDLGLGFKGVNAPRTSLKHRWFVGNHDNRSLAKKHYNNLGDYGYLEEQDLFFVSGAYSIDWKLRREGVSWWRDEELSYAQLERMVELFEKKKPKYVVTHDCPTSVAYKMMDVCGIRGDLTRTRTGQALQAAFDSHQPSCWVFGHWHRSYVEDYCGTRFICLPEFGTLDMVDIPPFKEDK